LEAALPYQPTWQNPYLAQNPYQTMAPQQVPPMQYQQPFNGITRVNGRDSALQYQLPPNSMSPALFDNNGRTFYIVSTDGTGAKTVEAFDYSEHVEQAQTPTDDFVSRAEFDELSARVSMALEALNGIQGPVSGQQQQRSGRRRQNAKGGSGREPAGGPERDGESES
jgi:hypothetical protein